MQGDQQARYPYGGGGMGVGGVIGGMDLTAPRPAQPPNPETEIGRELNDAREQVARLGKIAAELHSRLSPVLVQRPQEAAGSQRDDASCSSDLGKSLRELRRDAEETQRVLMGLLNSLAL